MEQNVVTGVIAMLVGAFTIFCAANDYDFFMNHHKAQFFVRLLGRNRTRVFYSLLGIFIVILGMVLVL